MSEAPRSVKEVFGEALEVSREARAAFLHAACAGDPDLRARVEALLAVHDATGGFLSSPTVGGPSGGLEDLAGQVVGAYRIERLLGEGGLGVVYLSEQMRPVVRKVALKVVKPGLDTREVIARFEAERQALALMDHANIAKVFDAGTTGAGRPYFVMELVDGEPITVYCDRERLDLRSRLALFTQVCRAVQHAHQKGVVHRDLKPNNVLVTTLDGRPHAKVIDFGVAKALDRPLTEMTLFTEHGRLIGTPEYMSPEQAEGSLDVDTRSDVYSLGVLLFELLTGTTPIERGRIRAAAYGEMLRLLREHDTPRPSSRVSTMGDAVAGVAACRHAEPRTLNRQLRGDLDWIVLKALEKDRGRRYETANGLAMDVERHLHDEPVLAGPPSRGYRLRKFVRRHAVGVTVAVTGVVLLALGTVGTTIGLVEASRERRVAEASEAKAREEGDRRRMALDLLGDMAQPSRTNDEMGRALSMPERLQVFSDGLGSRVRGEPEVEAEVRFVLGEAFMGLGAPADAEREFVRVVELRRSFAEDLDPNVGLAMEKFGWAAGVGGDLSRAVAIAQDSLDRALATGVGDHPEVAARHRRLAQAYRDARDPVAGADHARACLEMLERLGGHRQTDVADALALLASLERMAERWDEAEGHWRDAADVSRSIHGELHEGTTWQLLRIADARRDHGDRRGAIESLREAVAAGRTALAAAGGGSSWERVELARRLALLAIHLMAGVGPEVDREALAAAHEAAEIRREVRDVQPNEYVNDAGLEGLALWRLGRFAEAREVLLECLTLARTRDTVEFQSTQASILSSLVYVVRDAGRDLSEAEAFAKEGIEIRRRLEGDTWRVWVLEWELSALLRLEGRGEEAARLEDHAAGIEPAGAVSAQTALRLARTGEVLEAEGHPASAERFLRKSAETLAKLAPSSWIRHDVRCTLAGSIAAQGRLAEAEAFLKVSAEFLRTASDAPPEVVDRALRRVVDLYEAWEVAEPGVGHGAQAAVWRARFAESKDTARPPR